MKLNPRNVLRLINLLLLIFLLLISLPPIMASIFDFTNGKELINETLKGIVGNTTDPDEKALLIMAWEREYFYNPYSYYKANSTLQKLGIYKINGNYKLFVRPAPVSWIINSRMANCEEYARVFVTLMNEAGIKSKLIAAPGEDHKWAEYMHDNVRIAVDPSQNYVIGDNKKEFQKDMNVNFSYVEAVDIYGNKMDVSDEYIERGNLIVKVFDKEKPANNTVVIIKNPSFMETRSDRYNKPLTVLSKTTGTDGIASFQLGHQKYNVEIRDNYLYLFDLVYQKNVTIENGKVSLINLSLERDEKKLELFMTRYI